MKRSKGLQEAVDRLNQILANSVVVIVQETSQETESSLVHVGTSDPRAQLFKQGIADALEILLHRTNSYKGYCFLDPNDPSRQFDRKYF